MIKVQEQERKALEFIITNYRNTGFCPVSAEIADHLQVSRGGTINGILKRLEDSGHIIYNESRSRFIPSAWRDIMGNAKLQEHLDEQRRKTLERVQRHYAKNGRK